MSIKRYVSAALTSTLLISVTFCSFASDSTSTTTPPTKPSPAPAPVIKVESEVDRLTKEFGSEAALIIIASQNEIKTIHTSLDSLRKEIKAAKEAEEVDETALASLLENEKALQADLKAKEDALRIYKDTLKLNAEFGEEAAAEIIASRDEISAVRSSLDSLRKDIKAAKEAEEVDETALASLLEDEKALASDLAAKEKALNEYIKSLRPTPTPPTPPTPPAPPAPTTSAN